MFDQLKDILVSKFQLDPGDIGPDSTLTGLDLDSLDAVELSLVIEKEMNAKVSDVELADAQRLDEIARLVENRSARV